MARRLRENKLGVEASQVNLKINPERKAVQGLSIGDNDLTQVAKALSGIAPQINKFLMQEHDKINEKYHLDAERRVNELEFDPETNELAENMIKDNNNPSFLKSMEHFRGLKLARYASADLAQRYAGQATNDIGDNAYFPDRDDPEDIVNIAFKEFIPEGASDTLMKAFNQGVAKTHHQGREYFLQSVGVAAAKDKQEAGYFFLDDKQKDPQTGDYLPPEEAVEALMGSKQEFMKTHTEDEWYQQMLAQGAVRANQGDTEYVTKLSEMRSDLGLAFKDDPNFSDQLAQLGKTAVDNHTKNRLPVEIQENAELHAKAAYADVTPEELLDALDSGEILQDEFVDLSGKLASSTLRAQKAAKASAAKTSSYVSDERTKRTFFSAAIAAYDKGDKSKVQNPEPKFYPVNEETGKPLTISNADFKAGLNKQKAFQLGQQMSIKNRGASPKEIATNFADMINKQAKFMADSGGKHQPWEDTLARTYSQMLDSDAQMGQVKDDTAVGLQLALTLRQVNPAMFNKFTTSAQRKLFSQVASYTSVGLGERHETDQIKSIIAKVANEEALIANSKADTGDASLKDKRDGVKDLVTSGMTKLQADKVINNGLAVSRNDGRKASVKIEEIVATAEAGKIELADGSAVFKSVEQQLGFSAKAAEYSQSDTTISLGETLDLFLEKSKKMIADREPNQKAIIIQHPNNPNAYLVADEWGHPFHDKNGTWITTIDDTLAPEAGIRKFREENLEYAKAAIFDREFAKAMQEYKDTGALGTGRYGATAKAHERTREVIEEYLDLPIKDLPKDVKGFIENATDLENKHVEDARKHAAKIGAINRSLQTKGSSFLD